MRARAWHHPRSNPSGGTAMSPLKTAGLGTALALVLCAAQTIQPLDVRYGLWEITNAPAGGSAEAALPAIPQLPPDMLAKLTPEQRAKLQSVMQNRPAMNQPNTRKVCVTEASMKKGLDRLASADESNCTHTVTTSTSQTLDVQLACSGKHQATGTMHFDAVDHETIKGTLHVVAAMEGQQMTINRTIDGKWLSSDCGSVKPSE
jgi:hypothetical protein